MDFFVYALIWIGLSALIFGYYRLKRPEWMPTKKPKLKFFPKYKMTVAMPPSILEASDQVQSLTTFLSSAGFREIGIDGSRVIYSRGKWLGDAKLKYAKLNLAFELPLQSANFLEAEYGAFALFDTGALWLFCDHLSSQLDAPAEHRDRTDNCGI